MKPSIVVFHDKEVGLEVFNYLSGWTLGMGIALYPISLASFKESYDDLGVKSAPQWLRNLKPQWIISAWWPKILCPSILQCAEKTLNIHNSFLPWCRGKHPNFWSIVEQSLYGVTLHEMTSEIDGGSIYAQETIPITWEDTGGSLHAKSLVLAVDLFIRSWPNIFNGSLKPFPQSFRDEAHYKDEIEDASRIRLNDVYSGRHLLNILRARKCFDYRAWFEEGGHKYTVDVEIKRV